MSKLRPAMIEILLLVLSRYCYFSDDDDNAFSPAVGWRGELVTDLECDLRFWSLLLDFDAIELAVLSRYSENMGREGVHS